MSYLVTAWQQRLKIQSIRCLSIFVLSAHPPVLTPQQAPNPDLSSDDPFIRRFYLIFNLEMILSLGISSASPSIAKPPYLIRSDPTAARRCFTQILIQILTDSFEYQQVREWGCIYMAMRIEDSHKLQPVSVSAMFSPRRPSHRCRRSRSRPLLITHKELY